MFGQDFNNSASAPATNISTSNVNLLKTKWVFTPSGDVSARAAVYGNIAYFPDWGGNVYAVNTLNGHLVWSKNITTDYGFAPQLGSSFVLSRTSPFFDPTSSILYLGTQATANGAYLLAINTANGSLKWATQIDSHPQSVDTGSPIVYNGVVYLGVSSLEEGAAAFVPNYPCCSFRGSVVALDAKKGTILWKTYTVPLGYSGGAVWGSTLVPDPQLGLIYATTGNNYSTPTASAYTACIGAGGTEASCLSPNDHFDSVLALNMADGSINWSQRLGSADDWTVACFTGSNPGQGNCPTGAGPDYDFGSGVNLFTINRSNGSETVVGAGQKSGIYSVFDAATGQLVWNKQVGPGSGFGGIEWGSATDGNRIYVAISNLYGIPYTLVPSGQVDTAGSWSALDAATGNILWQTADPNGAVDTGPMTVANGVVYAASTAGSSTSQNMFALNAATGKILWSFAAGGSVNAGAVIANDTVYWGSGYGHFGSLLPMFTPHQGFYAFTLGGQ
jgi:polyvinyl alcohol dehydrogenase (cytochrome)